MRECGPAVLLQGVADEGDAVVVVGDAGAGVNADAEDDEELGEEAGVHVAAHLEFDNENWVQLRFVCVDFQDAYIKSCTIPECNQILFLITY